MTAKEALTNMKSVLDKMINNVLKREVLNAVKEAESEAVDKVVYSMPTSGYYQRRGPLQEGVKVNSMRRGDGYG